MRKVELASKWSLHPRPAPKTPPAARPAEVSAPGPDCDSETAVNTRPQSIFQSNNEPEMGLS